MGEEGDQNFSTSLVYEEFTDFWKGENKAKLPSSIEQWTEWLNYAYNITDELVFGITTGIHKHITQRLLKMILVVLPIANLGSNTCCTMNLLVNYFPSP